MSQALRESAPAKINLTLEILGRRADGYHELASLVAFAQAAADSLTLTPGPDLGLVTGGPEAVGLDGENLISKVAAAALETNPRLRAGTFHLTKRLPVAAGIGGGSADAGAALRLLAALNGIDDAERTFSDLAAQLGADIPVCLGGGGQRAAYMSGIGEKVWRPAGRGLLPEAGVAAVLVNPRVAVPTGKVFQALDARPIDPSRAAPPMPSPFADTNELLGYLRDHRSDLEAPARRIAPVIGAVLDALGDLPNALAARMSGSGATCLALFDDTERAAVAADIIASSHPNWWVVPTSLH